MVGQTIAHYQILERLGGGGMGVVYKAHDVKLDRPVALKFLPPDLNTDPDSNERFVREAKAASSLDHPNICTIYDIGQDDQGRLFIAMAYYEGQTLKYRLGDGLALDESVALAVQIAEGLARAHEAGIVHRDIKPANVMVTDRGRVKILDFGIAKLDHSAVLTKEGSTVGTAAYMSPEQTQGQEVDQRTDLWALGVVLYEMLTGQCPFQGDYAVALAYAIVNQDPVPLRELRPEVPDVLAQLVERLLRKDPEARYASAEALLADLRALKQGETVETQAVAPVVVATSPRRSLWLYGGGVLVLLVLAAFIASQLFSGGSRVIDSIAVLPLANLSGDEAQEYFSDGITDAVIQNLGQIEALRVISRTSVMPYKTEPKPLREVGRALDVAGVVEGTVKLSERHIEVTVRLYDAATEERLWSKSFERELKDVLTLQRNVALAIAREIEISISSAAEAHLSIAPEVHPKAFDLYLRGIQILNQRGFGIHEQAISFFEESIAIDSTFAPTHAQLALTYAMQPRVLMPEGALVKAKRAVERALELTPSLSEAYVARAMMRQFHDYNWAGAEQAFRHAIELDPGNDVAYHELAHLLVRLGRFKDALDAENRALYQNPLSALYRGGLGEIYLFSRQYDRALDEYKKALDLEPDRPAAYFWLSLVYLYQGSYEKALRTWEKTSIADQPFAEAYALMGRQEEAQEKTDALIARWEREERYVNMFWDIALAYAALDKKEEAIDWLERGYKERSSWMIYLKVHPGLDPLRSEPRFQALLEKMGLVDG